MKTITEKEFRQLIKTEKWTHETKIELSKYTDEVNKYLASLEVISTCSKLKFTLYFWYDIDDDDFVPEYPLNPEYEIQDPKGNQIDVVMESDNDPIEMCLTKNFVWADSTELQQNLAKLKQCF